MTQVGKANRSQAQMRAQTYSLNHYKETIEECVDFELWDQYHDDCESPLYSDSPFTTIQEWEDSRPFTSLKQRIEEDRKNDR